MKLEQTRWTEGGGWDPALPGGLAGEAHLVLLFAGTDALKGEEVGRIRRAYPNARLLGCSTSGEICGTEVTDGSIVVTAVRFDAARIELASTRVAGVTDSAAAGERLAATLPPQGLRHVFVLSDGLAVNGTELVRGLAARLPDSVTVTGGLSGDGARFQETLVVANGPPDSHAVAALGFYGDALRVGYASLGGWDAFGPERLVTRATGNVLYELDGTSALGEHAAGLPASGLLFPLAVRLPDSPVPVVRTILAVSEEDQSLTFAGDVPQGTYARLMKANFDRLIDGAVGAARAIGGNPPELAILISCVGRKLVLKQRIEEEVEGVRDVLGPNTVLTGFYSYGEISPFTPGARCELHNQTMTITTFSEK